MCKITGQKGDQGDTGLIGPKGDPGKLFKFCMIDHLALNFTQEHLDLQEVRLLSIFMLHITVNQSLHAYEEYVS